MDHWLFKKQYLPATKFSITEETKKGQTLQKMNRTRQTTAAMMQMSARQAQAWVPLNQPVDTHWQTAGIMETVQHGNNYHQVAKNSISIRHNLSLANYLQDVFLKLSLEDCLLCKHYDKYTGSRSKEYWNSQIPGSSLKVYICFPSMLTHLVESPPEWHASHNPNLSSP